MNLKKPIASLMAVMLALGTAAVLPDGAFEKSGLAVTADAASSDFIIEVDDYGTRYISGYKGSGGDIKIPSGVYINDKAFADNTTITSVTFPYSCYVYDSAFEGCTSLKKVVFEKNAFIGANSFLNCINLKSVEVKGSIYEGIGSGAFDFCYSLKSFKVSGSENEMFIGSYAFLNCYSLETVTIPESCTEIYYGAFLNCFSLSEITVPSKAVIFLYGNNSTEDLPFGYYYASKTEDDFFDSNFEYGLADGVTNVYYEIITTNGDGLVMSDGRRYNMKKFLPSKLRMYVTKGSSAEKYAKKFGIAYTYSKDSAASSNKLAAPTNVKASALESSIKLKWDAVDGADAYRIYIYNNETGKYEVYKSVKGTSCTVKELASGKSYKFKVAALRKTNGKYKAGNTSKTVSATAK